MMEEFEIFKIENEDEKEKFDFVSFFKQNKTYIYSLFFYFAGLICGSFIYKKCQSDVLNSILAPNDDSFVQMLVNNLSVYFLLFAISVLLGLCLVGFPFINLIPMLIGFETSMKVAYYYINYGIKGAGYVLLMIAPFVCFYSTVIFYAISMSYTISKNIYSITIKKEDLNEKFNYKLYLKKYLIYAGIIFIAAVINTAICTALKGIITM